jgi:hypothetical protein
MKSQKLLLASLTATLLAASGLHAEIKTAAPSPASKLDQVVGVTNFTVEYSRPSVKDREIYGDLVPFDELWRTGANAPTKVSFDSEITVGEKTVPAGDYVLFTIPGKDEWTVILSSDTEVANTGAYDEKNDVARVTVTPTALAEPVESFTIGFDNLRDDSATLFLDWANLRVPVPITIDTASLSAASIEAALNDQDSWTARDFANAAEFYSAQDMDLDQAVTWMKKATEMNENAFWWQYGYAKLLAKQGNKEEAIAAAKKSIATAEKNPGGDSGYIQLNEELLATLQ